MSEARAGSVSARGGLKELVGRLIVLAALALPLMLAACQPGNSGSGY